MGTERKVLCSGRVGCSAVCSDSTVQSWDCWDAGTTPEPLFWLLQVRWSGVCGLRELSDTGSRGWSVGIQGLSGSPLGLCKGQFRHSLYESNASTYGVSQIKAEHGKQAEVCLVAPHYKSQESCPSSRGLFKPGLTAQHSSPNPS